MSKKGHCHYMTGKARKVYRIIGKLYAKKEGPESRNVKVKADIVAYRCMILKRVSWRLFDNGIIVYQK